jgi:hypothetical protein
MTEKQNNMDALYNYIFWFNHHEDLWYAISRDEQLAFFNGNRQNTKHFKSKNITTLTEILNKPSILPKPNEQENNKTAQSPD